MVPRWTSLLFDVRFAIPEECGQSLALVVSAEQRRPDATLNVVTGRERHLVGPVDRLLGSSKREGGILHEVGGEFGRRVRFEFDCTALEPAIASAIRIERIRWLV